MLKIQNRPLRIIVRTLLYAGVFILFLFGALSVYIETNKKEILSGFRVQLGKKIHGKIDYTDADISVWKTFPFIGLHIANASVEDSLGIPLLKMEKISFNVSILQYFSSKAKLNNLALKNGFIHLLTDTSGYTNKYLFKSDTTTQEQNKGLELDKALLNNVRVIIENGQKNKKFDVLFKKLVAEIDDTKKGITIDLDQNTIINGLGFNLSKGSYLKAQQLKGFTRLRYDKEKTVLSFEDKDLAIDGQSYAITGNFIFNRDSFNLSVKTKNAPFEKLKRIFAENIFSDLKNIELTKPIDVEAKLEGSLAYKTIPKVVANWATTGNEIAVAGTTLKDCSFSARFTNEITPGLPLTDENSGASISDFSGNWEGILLKSKQINLKNLVNPVVEMRLQSETDLRSLNNKLGSRTIQFITGKASLDIYYNGPFQKDVSIIDKLSGNLLFSNGTIKYLPRNFTFNNCKGNVSFSADILHAKDLQFDLGSNHFNVDLAGTNLSALSSSDPGKATIQCNVSTPSLDLSELRSLVSAKKQVQRSVSGSGKIFSAASRIDEVLDHGMLRIFLNAGAVKYRNFNGRNLKGTVSFYSNGLSISGVSVDHAEGNMLLDGDIAQAGLLHNTSARVRLSNVDVSKVFRAFDDFGQDGISHENISGRLNANTNITMVMDDAGNIIPGSMKGTVDFLLKNGALVNFEPVQNIKSFVFKHKDMSNVTFAELKNKLEVNNYKIRIPRMEIQSSALGMFVEGVYDLKKTESKFDIQVPLKGLKKRDSTYVPTNIGIDKKAGTSIYLEGKNDKTGKVKIGLNTTKTIRKIF